MIRDTLGRFKAHSKVQSVIYYSKIVIAILFVVGIVNGTLVTANLIHDKAGWVESKVQTYNVLAYTATSTPSINQTVKANYNTTAQVQSLIDNLTTQEYNSATFTAETAKEEAALHQDRINAAIEQALFVVKTQYDMNVDKLTK